MAVVSQFSPEEVRRPALAETRAGFDAWWTLAITFGLSLVSYLDRQVVSMLVPEVKHALAVTDLQIGLLLGPTFAVSSALFVIPLGWVADRYSRRLVIMLGSITFGLATVVSGFAQTFGFLLLARGVVAIGESALGPASISLIAEKFPRNLMTTAVSIYSMGLKIGGAAALGLGAAAIVYSGYIINGVPRLSGLEAWRLVFTITGAPAVFLGLLVLTVREAPRRPAQTAGSSGSEAVSAVRFILNNRRLFIPMVLGFSLIAMCGQSLIGWTPALMGRQFGWKPAHYGPVLGGIALASSLLLVVKGAAMDWFYARGVKDIHIRFYTWLLMGSLPIVAATFLMREAGWFLVFYAVVAIITVPFSAYSGVAVQMVAPRALRGRLAAVVGIPMLLLSSLGPLIVGALTDVVFRNEARLNLSMATLFCVAVPGSLVLLRLALPGLRDAVIAAEARDAAERARADA